MAGVSVGNAAPVMQIERDWKSNDDDNRLHAHNTSGVETFLPVEGCR